MSFVDIGLLQIEAVSRISVDCFRRELRIR